MSERGVAEEVLRRLRKSGYLAHSAVTVSWEAQEGVLLLTGVLPSQYLKQLALAIATEVASDLKVVNHIAVRAGCSPTRGSFAALPSQTLGSQPTGSQAQEETGSMLVLSRKQSEAILIGNDIRIVLVGIRGSQVRIGIEAPESVKVYREELCNEASPPLAAADHSNGAQPRFAVCGGKVGRRRAEMLSARGARLEA
jgi:carbon storage regulator